jgi:hypothetical protein
MAGWSNFNIYVIDFIVMKENIISILWIIGPGIFYMRARLASIILFYLAEMK